MDHLTRRWRAGLALVFAVGAGRISFYYLLYEPAFNRRGAEIGAEYEQLRPFLEGVLRVGYLSDEAVDGDPAVPRAHDKGDMMYARAQYALAPTILAHSQPALPVVLANFADPTALDRMLQSGSYAVLSRANPAVALLRRK